MRLTALGVTVVVALAGLAGCGDDGDDSGSPGGGATTGAAREVAIEDFTFLPGTVEVEAGTTVRWTNEDDAAHTVRFETTQLSVESDALQRGGTFEQPFDEPGELPYVCGIHPYMEGVVVVR